MNCTQVEERLEAWVDGELSPSEARELEEHLADHQACALRAQRARRVRDGLRELPEIDASPDLVARIKARAREEAGGSTVGEVSSRARRGGSPGREGLDSEDGGRGRSVPWQGLGRSAALLAACLAVVALTLFLRPSPSQSPTGTAEAEVAAAAEEVRLALALVARAGRRAGNAVERELLPAEVAAATGEGLRRAFESVPPLPPPPAV